MEGQLGNDPGHYKEFHSSWLGLKENVILGHLVPAGTGYKIYYSLNAIPTEAAISENKEESKEGF